MEVACCYQQWDPKAKAMGRCGKPAEFVFGANRPLCKDHAEHAMTVHPGSISPIPEDFELRRWK